MASRLSSLRGASPVAAERRGRLRHAASITRATLRRHGDAAAAATLHDLSIYGCRLASDERHEAGERVWLRLASSMPIAATVVWDADGFTGCRFDGPIERGLMRSLTLSPDFRVIESG